jgi:hypothetical protein
MNTPAGPPHGESRTPRGASRSSGGGQAPPDPGPGRKNDTVDWSALERLRRAFLDGTAGTLDYWRSDRDLASYDATFAQRIGWKWDFVLADLRARGWAPSGAVITDWGCGTGIAARAFLEHFHDLEHPHVRFVDRSERAMEFAARRATERFPGVTTTRGGGESASATVLLSHVLTELQPGQVEALLAWLEPAQAILWVEPGTFDASRALIAIRERLRTGFQPVAPCTHGAACGILQPGNESHWCHHFAKPPAAVFTDPFWGRFAHLVGIDLRSVPLSYLVLDRRPAPPLAAPALRLLGRPRVLKPEVRLLACGADGVRERPLSRRAHPAVWHEARKDRLPSLLPWPELSARP